MTLGEFQKDLIIFQKLIATLASGGGGSVGGGTLAPAKDTIANSTAGMTIIGPDIISAAESIFNREGAVTADFTDTTDTAATIISSIPSGFSTAAANGASWIFTYINTTGYQATIAPGTGVTIIASGAAANALVPRLSSLTFVVTQSSPTTVTMNAVNASRLINYPPTLYYPVTATTEEVIPFSAPSDLKYMARTGPTANFTDTTDTAANMIAAIPGPAALNLVGLTWTLRYMNRTNFLATFAGGTGVTMDTNNQIGPLTSVDFMYEITSMSPAAITVINVS
jgi:hypothetical protein